MQLRFCKSVTSHTSHEGPHGLRSQPEVRIASAPYGRDAGWSIEGYPKATTTSTSSNLNLEAAFNLNCRVCIFLGSTRSTWRSRPTRQAWNDSKHRMLISASCFFFLYVYSALKLLRSIGHFCCRYMLKTLKSYIAIFLLFCVCKKISYYVEHRSTASTKGEAPVPADHRGS